jgi:hypothetical protein
MTLGGLLKSLARPVLVLLLVGVFAVMRPVGDSTWLLMAS